MRESLVSLKFLWYRQAQAGCLFSACLAKLSQSLWLAQDWPWLIKVVSKLSFGLNNAAFT